MYLYEHCFKFFFINSTAFIPIGVAALPNPKKFEAMFIQIHCSISGSFEATGNKIRIRGLKIREKIFVRPDFFAKFIRPEKKKIDPEILKQKFIVSNPPDKSDDNMSSVVPEKTPKNVEITRIITLMYPIIQTLSLFLIYVKSFTE